MMGRISDQARALIEAEKAKPKPGRALAGASAANLMAVNAAIKATRATPQPPTVPVPLAQVEALAEAVAEWSPDDEVELDWRGAARTHRAAVALLRSVGR